MSTRESRLVKVDSRDHVRGSRKGAVVLVEYGDYQCPHCAVAHAVVEQLLHTFGDKLAFVYRHFPLSQVHPNAQEAAEAAEAAGAQGRFWELHDTLYENQPRLERRDLLEHAALVGLDLAEFREDLQTHAHAERVREDFLGGVRSGVNGTPTFFVDGQRHDGRFDVDSLAAAIERLAGQDAAPGRRKA